MGSEVYVCESMVPFLMLYATLALRKKVVREVVQPGAEGQVVLVMHADLEETVVGQ